MKFKLLIIVFILIIAGYVRYLHYAEVPRVGDSFDEYSNAWVGLGLIKTGMPVGAMGVGGYAQDKFAYVNVDRIYQTGIYADPIKINSPWFDHPPGMGILVGSYSFARGARTFSDTTIRIIRQPMIVWGVLAVLSVILLGWATYGFWTGALAGMFYGMSPLIVVSSRMAQGENGFIPLFLLAMTLCVRFLRSEKEKYLYWAVFLAGVAIYFKLAAIMIILAIFGLVGRKWWSKILGIYIPFVLGWLVYGISWGREQFVNVFIANSQRVYGIGTQAVFDLITKTRITHIKLFTDGWILAGWLSLVNVITERKGRVLLAGAGSALIVYLLFGNYPYGWYALPIWPFLMIGLGRLIANTWRTGKQVFLSGLALLLPIGVNLTLLGIDPRWEFMGVWKWMSVTILAAFWWQEMQNVKNNKIIRILMILLLIAGWVINWKYINFLNGERWYGVTS